MEKQKPIIHENLNFEFRVHDGETFWVAQFGPLSAFGDTKEESLEKLQEFLPRFVQECYDEVWYTENPDVVFMPHTIWDEE